MENRIEQENLFLFSNYCTLSRRGKWMFTGKYGLRWHQKDDAAPKNDAPESSAPMEPSHFAQLTRFG
jgi:hypothetical protein